MPLEYPDQSYYPSVKVVFSVRFEEFSATKLKDQEQKKKLPQTLKGTKSDRTELTVEPDTTAPEYTRRFVLNIPGSETGKGRPTNASTSSDGLTFDIGGVIPKTMTLKRNSVRIADECELEIKWQDFPIDPRVIRACAVEVYVGTIPATDYAQGIAGLTRDIHRRPGQNQSEPLHLVGDVDAKGNSNLRFQGWVDDWDMTWPDGEGTIKMKCVDNTRMLIDQQAPPNLRIDNTKPIDEAIAQYLSHFPQMAGLVVEFRGDQKETTPPKLKDAEGKYFNPKDFGPAPAKGGGATGGEQLAVWDYLTDACGLISHLIRIEGKTIIIQRPKNALSRESIRPEDQYSARTVSGVVYPYRMFVFGRNLSEMGIKRNFTRKAVKNIEVRCYDPSRKAPLVGRFPKDPKDFVTSAGPGDGKVDNKWTVYRVDGVRDQATIEKVAEDLYHSVGRTELMAHLKTRNLSSWGGGNLTPDVLDLYAGDTIEIGVVRDEVDSTTNRTVNALSAVELNKEEMKRKGFPPEFASAFSKAYNDAGFQREFRVKEATFQWDTEKGIDIDIVAANFVEIRVDESSAQKDESGTGAPTASNAKAAKPVTSK